MITLRRATINDADVVLEWRNESATRRASFSDRSITRDEHLAWFSERLVLTHDESIWMVERDGAVVGNGRICIENDNRAAVSIVIDPELRGQGIGTAAIRLLSDKIIRMKRTPVAYIRPDNTQSMRAFCSAGFYTKFFDETRMELWA